MHLKQASNFESTPLKWCGSTDRLTSYRLLARLYKPRPTRRFCCSPYTARFIREHFRPFRNTRYWRCHRVDLYDSSMCKNLLHSSSILYTIRSMPIRSSLPSPPKLTFRLIDLLQLTPVGVALGSGWNDAISSVSFLLPAVPQGNQYKFLF